MAVALTCALLAFACNHEDDSGLLPAGESPMTFSTSVEQQLARSSSSNSWDGGEEVAIQIYGVVKRYIAATNGKLTAANGLESFYWQHQSETKTVQGWYPYRGSGNNILVVQQDQSGAGYQASDLLYAPAVDITFAGRESTPLKFYHQTAKVIINILNAEAATNPSDIVSVRIGDTHNLARSGNFATPTGNATQGTWSGLSTYVANLIPKELTPTGTALRSYAAFVIPQDMTDKKFIAVTLTNGNTYYYTPTGTDGVLQGGRAHTYNITVNRTGITVSVGDITDWTGTGTTDSTIEGGAGAWKVGDYYPDPNAVYAGGTLQSGTAAIGVVYWIDPSDSRHGKVVSFDQLTNTPWSDGQNTVMLGTTLDHGLDNIQLIAAYINNNNKSWSNFPIFEWIHNTKNGGNVDYENTTKTLWYLPSLYELEQLFCVYNNKPFEIWEGWGTYPSWGSSNDLNANQIFNSKLIEAGGKALGNNTTYRSSSEDGVGAYCINFNGGHIDGWEKHYGGSLTAVAIAKF